MTTVFSHQRLGGHIVPGPAILIDEADSALVDGFPWSVRLAGRGLLYAFTGRPPVQMHRLIIGARPGQEVDHRNGDGLDNRRDNLRLATHRLNLANQRPQVGRSSRFKGVSFARRRGKWEAYIRVDGRHLHLGCYDEELDAARAYDAAALEAWGEWARPNLVVA